MEETFTREEFENALEEALEDFQISLERNLGLYASDSIDLVVFQGYGKSFYFDHGEYRLDVQLSPVGFEFRDEQGE